jgi:sarcosine oxidase/L-pipecolate oxidase
VAATGRAPQKAVDHMQHALASISSHPAFADGIQQLRTSDDFKKFTWQYGGPLTGFKGYYNRLGGYAHSSDALKGIWEHCASSGIKFVLGESAGKAVQLLYANADAPADTFTTSSKVFEEGPESSRCVGIQTADGKRHFAETTICALGAHSASLIPKVGQFVIARCWSVAHVQLSEAETDYLRGIPTTNVRDLGFFFEPDPKTRLFKLCPLGAGFTNRNENGVSLPPPDQLPPPQDFIPAEDERKLRQLLRETFPWMAERPFVEQKLCWFADTNDSEYCIDFVPDTGRSLVVLSGDSGHGFKMMPIFGKWVVDLLESGKQKLDRWQWRGSGMGGDSLGNDISWRIGKSRELKDLVQEKLNIERARL